MENEKKKKWWEGIDYTPEDLANFRKIGEEALEALKSSDTTPQSSE